MQLLILGTFALLLIYIVLLIYYAVGWHALKDFRADVDTDTPVFISVIIPARDEERNLPVLLQGLKNQNYPAENFEVIVVDDHSTDKSFQVASTFSIHNLELISLKDHVVEPINSYKKKAIEVAVSQARGELIVTTDADCKVPPTWLQTIAAFYEIRKPAFIAMPVDIEPVTNALDAFQALDFMTLQGITAASAQTRFHNMCNGANLAYTKEAFDAVDGFKGIDAIASGDDMLLMQKISQRFPGKVEFLRSKNVIVQTQPMNTIAGFFNQRIRWASKTGTYQDKRLLFVLVIVYFLNVFLFTIPVISIIKNEHYRLFKNSFSLIGWWFSLVLIKTFFELFFLYPVARFFNKASLLFIFPLLQPFHIIYTVIAGWLGKFGSYHWKKRRVK